VRVIPTKEQRREDDVEMERQLRTGIHDEMLEESGDQYFERMFSKNENLPMTTVVPAVERPSIVQAQWFADSFDLPWLDELIKLDMMLRVSGSGKDGRGRREALAAMIGSVEVKQRRIWSWRRREG